MQGCEIIRYHVKLNYWKIAFGFAFMIIGWNLFFGVYPAALAGIIVGEVFEGDPDLSMCFLALLGSIILVSGFVIVLHEMIMSLGKEFMNYDKFSWRYREEKPKEESYDKDVFESDYSFTEDRFEDDDRDEINDTLNERENDQVEPNKKVSHEEDEKPKKIIRKKSNKEDEKPKKILKKKSSEEDN